MGDDLDRHTNDQRGDLPLQSGAIVTARALVHVVDDDESFRTAVERMLRMCKFEVALYASADQLLDKPLPVNRGCILLDVQMIGLDGLELQTRLTRLNGMRSLLATLTAREREVFDLFVRGKLNKQIAYQLGTSERTIKAHRHSVMQKLSVNSVAEAVSIAERLGMLAPSSEMQNSIS
jgi:FixJ family two-component response regulator